jgi:hypothetical protein
LWFVQDVSLGSVVGSCTFLLPLQSILYLEPLAARGVSLERAVLDIHVAASSIRHHFILGLSRPFPSNAPFVPGNATLNLQPIQGSQIGSLFTLWATTRVRDPQTQIKKYVLLRAAALVLLIRYRVLGRRRSVSHLQRTASLDCCQRTCLRRSPTSIVVPCSEAQTKQNINHK